MKNVFFESSSDFFGMNVTEHCCRGCRGSYKAQKEE